MEIKGKISWVGEIQNTGKENRVSFEITELEGQYPNSLVLDIYGNEKVENFLKFNMIEDKVTAEYNSRVFTTADGRKFNSLSSWKITK
jgi:hypothetical protein